MVRWEMVGRLLPFFLLFPCFFYQNILATYTLPATDMRASLLMTQAATEDNTPSTLVKRDESGVFSATTVIANLQGNATTAGSASTFTSPLSGDITGTQSATVVSTVGLQTAANVALATVAANAATASNTADTIVKRDGSGNFSAGTITGALTGAASANVLKAGDTMIGHLVVSNQQEVRLGEATASGSDYVGLRAPADVTTSYTLTLPPATGTADQVLKTDGSGNLSWVSLGASGSYILDGGNIPSATLSIGTNNAQDLVLKTNGATRLTIDSSGEVSIADLASTGVVHASATGELSSSLIVNDDITDTTITDAKLQTISTTGKVANSATTATSTNTADTIVLRDGSGNFSAGTITGALTGAASANVLKAGDTMTGSLVLSGTTSDLTVGGLATFEDDCYFDLGVPAVPAQVIQVTKGTISGPNQFNSIKDAVDSITDASASKPYLVYIGCGVYTEDTITMQSYVHLAGESSGGVIVRGSNANNDVIIGAASSSIRNLRIGGATGTGACGVKFTGGGIFDIIRCCFESNDTMILAQGLVSPMCFIRASDMTFTNESDPRYGIVMKDSSIYPVYGKVTNVTWLAMASTQLQRILSVEGPGSYLLIDAFTAGNPVFPVGGTGAYVSDGAVLGIKASGIYGLGIGMHLPAVGTAPELVAMAVSGRYNTQDLLVEHPGAYGIVSGMLERTKVTIDDDAQIALFFADPVAGGSVTVGPLYAGQSIPTLTYISPVLSEQVPTGLLNGGVCTNTSGRTIQITAGDGYLLKEYQPATRDGQLWYVSWSQQDVEVDADSEGYLYIDKDGVAHFSTTQPSPFEKIVLVRVRSTATGILYIQEITRDAQHMSTNLDTTMRIALGPIYASGSLVSKVNTLELAVSSGHYFFSVYEFTPSGGNPISWQAFYRTGVGSAYTNVSQSEIDYDHYDDGSGILASIPADEFARHALYVVGDGAQERYLLVYGQETFETIFDAQNGSIPPQLPTWEGNIALIASIIVKNTSTADERIFEIRDERPRIGFKPSGLTAITNHGDLSGLSADDHPQYLLANGARAMIGTLDMDTNNIINVDTLNGVTVEGHAARHLPLGADALATATPVDVGTTNSEGIQNSFARSDHVHAHGNQLGGSLHAVATTSTAGFMSAADKVIVDAMDPALLVFKTGSTMTGSLVMADQTPIQLRELAVNGTDAVSVRAPAALGSSYTLTLPDTAGTSGYVLSTDGSGNLGWSNISPAAGYIVNGGNTLGADITIGTNDAYALNLETSGMTRMTMASDGAISTTDALTVGGGCDVTGDFAVATNKFTVASATGNTAIAGTTTSGGKLTVSSGGVEVTGNSTIGGTCDVSGDFSVATNKLTVASATGNTNVAGTLTSANTLTVSGGGASITGGLGLSGTLTQTGNQVVSGSIQATSTITATGGFIGNLTGAASLNVLKAGDTMTGNLVMDNQTQLRLRETTASGTDYVALQAPATLAAPYTLTMPVNAGSNAQVLTTNGSGALSWQYSVPRVTVHAYLSSNTNINASNTPQIIPFNTTLVDVGNNFNTTTNTFTAPVAGYYHIVSALSFDANRTQVRYYELYKNGTPLTGYGVYWQVNRAPVSLSGIVSLAANDTLTFYYTGRSGDTILARYTNLTIQLLY